ncbi:hypothetical protein E1189_04715 [Sansalvadorimonas verongulae]|nr:hypothetical protein [Sansalvadorimonas verongulae]
MAAGFGFIQFKDIGNMVVLLTKLLHALLELIGLFLLVLELLEDVDLLLLGFFQFGLGGIELFLLMLQLFPGE